MSALLQVAGVTVSPDHFIDGKRFPSAEQFDLHSPIDQSLLPLFVQVEPIPVVIMVSVTVPARLETVEYVASAAPAPV